MINIFQSLLLGIVEGFTEFLPISSTAHLILTSHALGIEQTEFTKSFEIIIQLGAILAVIWLYFKTLFKIETIKKLVVGFIPTGIIGLTLYKIVKEYLIGSITVVTWSLLIGGLGILIFEHYYGKRQTENTETENTAVDLKEISYKQALAIGIFQTFAMIPGISRSAATVIGGLILGIKKRTIVEFSFLLAVPTMLAASVLDLIKSSHQFTNQQFQVLGIGFVVSFITAVISIKWLLGFVRKHDFKPFGYYRIGLAVLVAIILFII
jgi:undecaprenyl-diphosphatase